MTTHVLMVGSGATPNPMATATNSRFRGCLLGGAVGDALGAPVEFSSMDEIRRQFGAAGIRNFRACYGRIGAITDDTQMTLFTAEGLLRSAARFASRGICHTAGVVHHAYLRWLRTQNEVNPLCEEDSGWLIEHEALWAIRAPGTTCLSALKDAAYCGQCAVNDSKGCGGVMRVAPVGLLCNPKQAFELGSEIAALTHGHQTSSCSSGFLAALISHLNGGAWPASITSSAGDNYFCRS